MGVVSIKKFKKINFGRKKVVLAGGSFDIINYGHLRFLEKCKKLGDILIIGLADDKNIRERKGEKRPLIRQKYRAELLAGLKPVDYVFISRISAYSEDIIKTIKPDVVALPFERGKYKKRHRYKKETEFKSPWLKVVLLPRGSKISTTKIINKILLNYFKK